MLTRNRQQSSFLFSIGWQVFLKIIPIENNNTKNMFWQADQFLKKTKEFYVGVIDSASYSTVFRVKLISAVTQIEQVPT